MGHQSGLYVWWETGGRVAEEVVLGSEPLLLFGLLSSLPLPESSATWAFGIVGRIRLGSLFPLLKILIELRLFYGI